MNVGNVGSGGTGVCYGHVGPTPYNTTLITGADTVNAEGLPIANLTAIGICSCGHISMVTTNSTDVIAEGTGVHRVGDSGQSSGTGAYTLISGTTTVNAD